LYVLAAYKAPFSPHAKIGYQWNSDSVLLNLSGVPGANQRLPGGLQSAVGVDYGASRHLTISADVLANEFQNSPSISQVPFISTVSGASLPNATAPPAGGPCSPITLAATTTTQVGAFCTVNTVNKTITTINFSGGVKWKPFITHDMILYGNVLIQTSDVGLRAEPSPSVGMSYNFGHPKCCSWLYR
jgi:hypothetical protein